MIFPLFPEGGLASSVITTVWIGVFVLTFFNLRFGWVMSGLVVPGYIVPLLILKPVAVGVIIFEAILTYGIVWLFSEKLNKNRWNALFGRDRFLALILASIIVRVLFDGWLLPITADWLSTRFDTQIDWQNNLQSFGLVVISLMANQFWKPGLKRGLFSLVVVTGITWFIVRYGLMEFTNFRLSGVSYIYEGLASSILASPKAYIILVVTAIAASRMNLRYGWDFSGILIPALIALQWYQPSKILSSFVEMIIIYVLARLVMRLPMLANVTIEGSAKLLLFFNVSFVYKLVLGHIIAFMAWDMNTTDFYGFGYLLSTLLAIKAHDKDILPRLMRSTLGVSLTGMVMGNIIGFLLAYLLPQSLGSAQATALQRQEDAKLLFARAVGGAHVRARTQLKYPLSQVEAQDLASAIELLEAGTQPQFIEQAFIGSGYRVSRHASGELAIMRKLTGEMLLFNPSASRNLTVMPVNPAEIAGITGAAYRLYRLQDAKWLIITSPETDMLQSAFAGATKTRLLEVQAGAETQLSLGGRSGGAIDLATLRRAVPGLQLRFDGEVGNAADGALLSVNVTALSLLNRGEASPIAPSCDMPKSNMLAHNYSVAELAYLRFEIAEPIVGALQQRITDPAIVPHMAQLAGYQFGRCQQAGRILLRLITPQNAAGYMLFDPQGNPAHVLQTEQNMEHLLPVAMGLATQWRAGALLVAAHDEEIVGTQSSPFGTISQSLIRAQGDAPGALLQVRSERVNAPGTGGQVAILTDWVEPNSSWGTQIKRLTAQAGYKATLIMRGEKMAGYEIAPNMAIAYLSQSLNKRSATIWVARPKEDENARP